jgi:uncharacterized protein YyaL (SSP411 family)
VSALRRYRGLVGLAVADALGGRGHGRGATSGAIDAGVRWLCRTHDVTGRRGSAKGFSLLHGWLPAYPETTGYVIGTLLDHGRRVADGSYAERARELGDWEIEVQNADGGVMEGAVRAPPTSSVVFNTGMVVHGFVDLHAQLDEGRFLDAAVRAGDFLAELEDDGTWPAAKEYSGLPHTYNSRVDWALLRLADATGDARYRETAVRNLDWVLSVQRPNGWFDKCVFKTGMLPSTHGLAYTMRGLLESSALLGEDAYLEAARRTAHALAGVFERLGKLPATYGDDWSPGARYQCLTGTAQVGGVWLRLYQLTGEERLLELGRRAVAQAASRQLRGSWADVDGALPGSFPVWGRYAPLQFPNWATKFLVDSLVLVEECVSATSSEAPARVSGERR